MKNQSLKVLLKRFGCETLNPCLNFQTIKLWLLKDLKV